MRWQHCNCAGIGSVVPRGRVPILAHGLCYFAPALSLKSAIALFRVRYSAQPKGPDSAAPAAAAARSRPSNGLWSQVAAGNRSSRNHRAWSQTDRVGRRRRATSAPSRLPAGRVMIVQLIQHTPISQSPECVMSTTYQSSSDHCHTNAQCGKGPNFPLPRQSSQAPCVAARQSPNFAIHK